MDLSIDLKTLTKDQLELLGESLKDSLKASMVDLVKVGQERLAGYVQSIANDTMEILQHFTGEKRDNLLKSLANQLALVAEWYRIEIVNESWELLRSVFFAVVQTLLTTAKVFLG